MCDLDRFCKNLVTFINYIPTRTRTLEPGRPWLSPPQLLSHSLGVLNPKVLAILFVFIVFAHNICCPCSEKFKQWKESHNYDGKHLAQIEGGNRSKGAVSL